MKGFVYILKSETGRYYVGSTSNINRRMIQHNKGYTPSTKRMTGLNLVFSQECISLKDARYLEHRIKKLKRKDYIEKIISDGYIKIRPC